jgi:hypothetical protein
MSAFAQWCQLRRLSPLPAPPAVVALFVEDCHSLGADRVWQALEEVSKAHRELGYPDPTLGPPVSTAMNEVSEMQPPRSWNEDHRQMFMSLLPYPVQKYIHQRELERNQALDRALTKIAKEKHVKDPANAAA